MTNLKQSLPCPATHFLILPPPISDRAQELGKTFKTRTVFAITLLTFYQDYQAQPNLCDDSEGKLLAFPCTSHMIEVCDSYSSCKYSISSHSYNTAMGRNAVIFIFHINKAESGHSKPRMSLPFCVCLRVYTLAGLHVEA